MLLPIERPRAKRRSWVGHQEVKAPGGTRCPFLLSLQPNPYPHPSSLPPQQLIMAKEETDFSVPDIYSKCPGAGLWATN